MESKLMVDDVYDILTAVLTKPEGRVAMCANHTVSALCKAVAYRYYSMSIVSLGSLGAYCKLFDISAIKKTFLSLYNCSVSSWFSFLK